MRYRAVGLLLMFGIAAIAVAVVAVRDHHRNRARIVGAQEAQWYCTYKRRRCGGPDPDRLHEAWERREAGYKVAEGALGAAIVIGGGVVLVGRRPDAKRLRSPES